MLFNKIKQSFILIKPLRKLSQFYHKDLFHNYHINNLDLTNLNLNSHKSKVYRESVVPVYLRNRANGLRNPLCHKTDLVL